MFMIRKKDVLQELAVVLYLTQQFNPVTTAASVLNRLKERADAALQAAEVYTGKIGDKELRDFLTIHPLRFSIDCGSDIIKGDVIRFQEQVFNNKVKPPIQVGIRGIIAQITGTSTVAGKPMVHLRVVSSGGVWAISPDEEIRRTLRIITRMEVMRAPWDDEAKRETAKNAPVDTKPQIKTAKLQIVGRANSKKTK